MIPRIYEVENIGSGFLAVMAKPVSGEWIEEEFPKFVKFRYKTHKSNTIGCWLTKMKS